MTDELATTSELSITANQTAFTAPQIAALTQLGMENASAADIAIFFHHVKRTGLDPFARQTYMIGRRQNQNGKWVTKQTIQTGIDGFRLIARRATDERGGTLGYEDTQWCGRDGVWKDVWLESEPPAAARLAVLRDGERFPATALYSEYAGLTKDGTPTAMWKTKAALMLAKCAEALALRKAFPQDLSGIYTSDEMQQADNHDQPEPSPAVPLATQKQVAEFMEIIERSKLPKEEKEKRVMGFCKVTEKDAERALEVARKAAGIQDGVPAYIDKPEDATAFEVVQEDTPEPTALMDENIEF